MRADAGSVGRNSSVRIVGSAWEQPDTITVKAASFATRKGRIRCFLRLKFILQSLDLGIRRRFLRRRRLRLFLFRLGDLAVAFLNLSFPLGVLPISTTLLGGHHPAVHGRDRKPSEDSGHSEKGRNKSKPTKTRNKPRIDHISPPSDCSV